MIVGEASLNGSDVTIQPPDTTTFEAFRQGLFRSDTVLGRIWYISGGYDSERYNNENEMVALTVLDREDRLL